MQTCHCPSCGKSFTLADPSLTEAFCQYCGQKILLTPPSSDFTHIHTEHTERYVDEADLQRAKNENRVIGVFAAESEEQRAQKDHERQMEAELLRLQADMQRIESEERRDERKLKEKFMEHINAIAGFCLIIVFYIIWGFFLRR